MTDLDDARRLLDLAKVDLKAVRNMLDPERFEDSVFGFHGQQAVEKTLKAWLSLRGVAYPRTHDLRLLMSFLESKARERCDVFESLADLTDFAVQFRYDYPADPHGMDRSSVVAEVEAVLDHVESLLRGEQVGA